MSLLRIVNFLYATLVVEMMNEGCAVKITGRIKQLPFINVILISMILS